MAQIGVADPHHALPLPVDILAVKPIAGGHHQNDKSGEIFVTRVVHDQAPVIAYLVRTEGIHDGLVAFGPASADGNHAVVSASVLHSDVLRLQAT